MLVQSYTKDDSTYDVYLIMDGKSISSDIASVLHELDGVDIQEYTVRMYQSVFQQLAIEVFKDDIRVGFMYAIEEDNRYIGCSINLGFDPTCMIVGLKTIFEIAEYNRLEFVPHKNNLQYFKAMVDVTSVKAYYQGVSNVFIYKDSVVTKGKKIFEYLGVK